MLCEREFPVLSTGKREARKQLADWWSSQIWKHVAVLGAKLGIWKKSVFLQKHEANMMDENRISTTLGSQHLQIDYLLKRWVNPHILQKCISIKRKETLGLSTMKKRVVWPEVEQHSLYKTLHTPILINYSGHATGSMLFLGPAEWQQNSIQTIFVHTLSYALLYAVEFHLHC